MGESLGACPIIELHNWSEVRYPSAYKAESDLDKALSSNSLAALSDRGHTLCLVLN